MVTHGVILSERYLLQDELGAGGMSVVYKAVDLRTGAHVAVKIPHAFLLRDQNQVQRLKREAKIAAALQSSRIARVTDVGEHDGTPYFVMEYVPGETLVDRLNREGALPPLEALHIALEIARAIEVAHAGGVVHRDLKPHNVRITPDGDVKVIDFGIARLEGSSGLTNASLYIGTPEYASPERAQGDSDTRSDIYSIGVMLYEMLRGRLPFKGTTPWSVIQMHVVEPPPPLPETLPESARAIVSRCLEKRPENRYQTPGELVRALQAAVRELEFGVSATQAGAALPAPETVPMATNSARSAAPQDSRIDLAPPPQPSDASPLLPPTTRAEARRRRGWLLPATAGVAVLAAVALTAVLLLNRRGDGGSIADGETAAGATAVSPAVAVAGLPVLQPRDGARISGPVTVQLDAPGLNLKAPAESDPVGLHIHYFLDIDPATVLAPGAPIPTGAANIIHTPSASHTFLDLAPGPHTVWAVLTGNDHVPLTPLVQGVVSFVSVPDPLLNARPGSAAPIVYQGLVDGKWRIFAMDGTGANRRRLTGGNANDFNPAFSPDGARIAFQSDRDGSQHIYTMNLDGSDIRRITSGASNNRSPSWSADGKELAFQSDRDGRDHLWIAPVAGGEPRQITRGAQNDGSPSFSLDGSRIAFHSDQGGGATHIFTVDRNGGAQKQLTEGPTRDNRPVWSPDGNRIAFASFRDNQWNIYVMNADGSESRRLTDSTFNINPSWSPDGRQLLFQSDREGGQQQIFVIPVEGGAATRLTDGPAINAAPSWPLK